MSHKRFLDNGEMIDCACTDYDIKERNGHTASCNRLARKLQAESLKPPKTKKPIDKVGKNNTFECSDGGRVNQEYINKMRDLCYSLMDVTELSYICHGCFKHESQGHAHIIPQSRCKAIAKTDLIWNPNNIFYACHKCNAIAENVSSIGITKLLNFNRIKAFLELHDPERHAKICYTENELHKI